MVKVFPKKTLEATVYLVKVVFEKLFFIIWTLAGSSLNMQ